MRRDGRVFVGVQDLEVQLHMGCGDALDRLAYDLVVRDHVCLTHRDLETGLDNRYHAVRPDVNVIELELGQVGPDLEAEALDIEDPWCRLAAIVLHLSARPGQSRLGLLGYRPALPAVVRMQPPVPTMIK